MNPDIARWDDKYRASDAGKFTEVDPLLIAHESLLEGTGRALDVACGAGANALYAAARGYAVVAVDGSIEGLKIASARARAAGLNLSLVNLDLEHYRPPPNAFDLVMVFRYLNRGLFAPLKNALRPGGRLFFKTFNRNFLEAKPDFNTDYVLSPGELAREFSGLDIVSLEEGDSTQSFIVATKPRA